MPATPLNIVSQATIGSTLMRSIQQAYVQKRISFGVFECASILESNPDAALVVVLPGAVSECDDITVRLQTTLVEAFCWEHGVRLIKVANPRSISRALAQCPDARTLKPLKNADVNCIVIECADELSEQDKDVVSFFEASCEHMPLPVVQLPSD